MKASGTAGEQFPEALYAASFVAHIDGRGVRRLRDNSNPLQFERIHPLASERICIDNRDIGARECVFPHGDEGRSEVLAHDVI
jgi:hypothetical protein